MNKPAAFVVGAGSVFGILILVGQLLLIGLIHNAGPQPPRTASGGSGTTQVECSPVESLATHYHVALRIHRDGRVDVLPAQTGIQLACIYWLHVHDNSGIVHIEGPAAYQDHVFVLADLFGVAKLRLDAHHLGGSTFSTGSVAVYADGQRLSGAPEAAPLVASQTLDIVAPGEAFSYKAFGWPKGFLPAPTA
jgi:hypothetical protein